MYPLRCRSWRCASCAPRKARATVRRIAAGIRPGATGWFTLTSPPGEDPATSYDLLQARWHRLLQRVHRRIGPLEFASVVERQGRGAAHIHVVYRGRPIPKAWLSKAAVSAGFGRKVDAKPTVDAGVAAYLGKQLAAEIHDPSLAPPAYFHRVRFSRHWDLRVPPPAPRRWTAWYIAAARPEVAAISARARGYDVVECVGIGPPRAPLNDRVLAWYRDLRTCLVVRRREVLT